MFYIQRYPTPLNKTKKENLPPHKIYDRHSKQIFSVFNFTSIQHDQYGYPW